MRASRLQLRSFTAFASLDLPLVPGINLFLGENGTGKTHCLQVLYAALRDETGDPPTGSGALSEVFFQGQEGDLQQLRRPGADDESAPAVVETPRSRIEYLLDRSPGVTSVTPRPTEGPPAGSTAADARLPPPILLSSGDLLSLPGGLLRALRAAPSPEPSPLTERIEALLGGRFVEREGRWWLRTWSQQEIAACLVSGGLCRIGLLGRLIETGAIGPGGALLWDEPEAGLHPRLVTRLADLLLDLARSGVQIFLATHDYLLARHLSLLAEYGQATREEICFHGFFREHPGSPVTAEQAEDLPSLEHESMLEELSRHYTLEQRLFQQASQGRRR
jgi:energy-coupling factor transporter ATP-binding protein EcfA2